MKGFKIICENCGADLAYVDYSPSQYWSEDTQESAECTIECPVCKSYYDYDTGYYYEGDISEI